jgi:8-oxo-dGTP pyrophosphatase MutT (NUDIX family)
MRPSRSRDGDEVMDAIIGASGDWQGTIGRALDVVARPIAIDPRFTTRDARGRTGATRFRRQTFPPARQAATLLLLYPSADSHHPAADGRGELTIPLTVRRAELRAHAGEVSLPGGAVDPDDASLANAARREAWEELGVEPASVRILGELDPIWIPVSNFELHPFVGAVDRRPDFRPHDAEVAEVVELPLRLILTDDILAEEEFDVRGLILRTGVYRHAGQRIWGATARTLGMFATVLRAAAASRPPA